MQSLRFPMMYVRLCAPLCLALSIVAMAPRVWADPAPARPAAPDTIEVARERMERGQALYLQGRYLEAAEEFQRAYEAQPFGAFLYNAAAAYEKYGDATRASEFFTRYLERNPESEDAPRVRERIQRLRVETTPAVVPGEPTGTPLADGGVVEPGDAAVATTTAEPPRPPTHAEPLPTELPSDMKSLVSVRTDPDGAQVILHRGDRQAAAGPTPFVQTLQEGNYRITIRHPDYRTAEDSIHIEPGTVYVVIVKMSQGQFHGYLQVISQPPSSKVFIDDRRDGTVGDTPFQNVVTTGRHRIWLERAGYQTVYKDVMVGVGQHITWRARMDRVTHGRLRITTNISGAKVSIDKHAAGTVPFEKDLRAGVHKVRVSGDGMKDYETEVRIERGQVTPLEVRLLPAVGRGKAWVTSVFAALALAGGIVLAVQSDKKADSLKRDRDAGTLSSDDSRYRTGQLYSIGADISFGLGGILTGLATYYFLRDPLPDSEGTTLAPRDWALAPLSDPSKNKTRVRWSF